jgi:hypothetical protein
MKMHKQSWSWAVVTCLSLLLQSALASRAQDAPPAADQAAQAVQSAPPQDAAPQPNDAQAPQPTTHRLHKTIKRCRVPLQTRRGASLD